MNVAIFVNSQREIEKLNILLKSVSIDYELIITDSFSHLVKNFESKEISVLLCQLENPNCTAVEIFQLARMYNPNTINIAIGSENSMEELIETFNKENLFRFILLPITHKNDILEPIDAAFKEMHQQLQHEYEGQSFEEENSFYSKELSKYTSINTINDNALQAAKSLYSILNRQTSSFYKALNNNQLMELSNLMFTKFVDSYYISENSLNTILAETIKEYRNEEDNKSFSIKHALTDSPNHNVKSRIVYIISVLTEYIASFEKGYTVNILVSNKDNHYLIKFQNSLSRDELFAMKKSADSPISKLLELHLSKACKKWNLSFTDDCMEYRVVVN